MNYLLITNSEILDSVSEELAMMSEALSERGIREQLNNIIFNINKSATALEELALENS